MSSPQPQPLERLTYTIDEWCAATRMSRSHWNREIRAGRLKTIKEGSRTLIPASERSRFEKAAA